MYIDPPACMCHQKLNGNHFSNYYTGVILITLVYTAHKIHPQIAYHAIPAEVL